MILLGGRGTRIQGLYPDRPKALVPVAGKAILQWQIEWLLDAGISRVHLAAGHMSDKLEEWLKTGPVPDADITIATEPEPMGTGGALKWNLPHVGRSPFLAVNGDSLAPELDFTYMLDAHNSTDDAEVTMAVAEIRSADRYGTVEFDDVGRITAFREKEPREHGWINAGVYLMNTSVLDDIEDGKCVSLENEVFPELSRTGTLFAHRTDGRLLDMGTEDGLKAMEEYLTK